MFYVYENWTRDRGRIHRAECSYCNNGKGFQTSDSGRSGRWLPPFQTREDAFKAAEGLGRKDMKPCAVCNP